MPLRASNKASLNPGTAGPRKDNSDTTLCESTLAPLARRDSVESPSPAPVILFDGVCNLCNAWVRFVVRHDRAGIFRFAAQQSPIGQAMIAEHISGSWQLSSVILIAGDSVYSESTAVLEICAQLAPPWSWIRLARFIPRGLRDACYRFVVRHRYQWFGRTDTCQVPSEDVRSRFIG
jgi:predicted DCC family thiol-disulfide oxidoreductase YuxK